jgi:hypothetical protein
MLLHSLVWRAHDIKCKVAYDEKDTKGLDRVGLLWCDAVFRCRYKYSLLLSAISYNQVQASNYTWSNK